ASAENGKAAFLRHGCWQCHGYQGQGGIAGLRLAPNPIPFETLSNFVRTTNRAMPPFSKAILSDEDLADIYASLQSIPKGPDPSSIPLLNQGNGQCHSSAPPPGRSIARVLGRSELASKRIPQPGSLAAEDKWPRPFGAPPQLPLGNPDPLLMLWHR